MVMHTRGCNRLRWVVSWMPLTVLLQPRVGSSSWRPIMWIGEISITLLRGRLHPCIVDARNVLWIIRHPLNGSVLGNLSLAFAWFKLGINKSPSHLLWLEQIDTGFCRRCHSIFRLNSAFSQLIYLYRWPRLFTAIGIHLLSFKISVYMSDSPWFCRLDPALVRPGRVDYRVEVGLCTTDQLERMFTRFYPAARSSDMPAEFARTLGACVVSPAQVQGFLLVHKSDPRGAMAALPTFREACLRGNG